jgi:CheY-specific phosphatase CheX
VIDPSLQQALQESTEEVLEKMFFIQCLGEPLGSESETEIVAHLTFEGDPSGALTLAVTANAARSVAADFLAAEEPDLSEQEIGEVVCELANMICGSVLSRVESSATFRLGSPRIVAPKSGPTAFAPEPGGSKPSIAGASHSVVHAVEIGSGRMVVSIDTEKPAWPTPPRYAF